MALKKKNSGFTLVEVTVSLVIALTIIGLIATFFSLAQKTFRQGGIRAELTQNGRVAFDLISRELRQAKAIVTALPPNDSNPETIAREIEFEDGGNSSQIQYIRYHLSGGSLYREVIVYYFETAPETYVRYNETDPFGGPEESSLEDRIVGENFTSLGFWGQTDITVNLTLQKSNETMTWELIVNPRNI